MDHDKILIKIAQDLAALKAAFRAHLDSHRIRWKLITFIWSGVSFMLGLWLQFFIFR